MLPSSHVSVLSTLSKDNTSTSAPPLSHLTPPVSYKSATALLRRKWLKLTLKQGVLIGSLMGLQTTGSIKGKGSEGERALNDREIKR